MKNRWFSWRRFFTSFALCFVFCMIALSLGGCTAAWIGALQAMIPGISGVVSAIVAFVSALNGKTVSTSFNSAVQTWAARVADLLGQLETLVQSAASSATSTVMSQIQSVMSQLSQSLGTILADSGITDPNTQSKIEELFALFSGAVNAVLALIPLALARIKAGAPLAELEKVDGNAKNSINEAHSALRTTYHSIVTQATPNLDVNEALQALPQSLP